MRKKARQRAEQYRLRAEELRHLGQLTNNPMIKQHYEKIADSYLTLAEEEDTFAQRAEELETALADRRRSASR